jgi:hypothetical protein
MNFDWDEGNRDKNVRHSVHDWEIEEALQDPQRIGRGAHRFGASSGAPS